jgi:PRTRC genetic system ThiF family protein
MIHYLDHRLLQNLEPITVHLIGAGGTGSRMLTALANINHSLLQIGHKGLNVTVFDKDVVSLSNVGRQLFSPNDIGYNKAFVSVCRCNQYFGTNWSSKAKNYPDKFKPANIIITCVDNAETRHKIQKLFSTYKTLILAETPIYWLDFGNSNNHGQIILGTFGNTIQPENVTSFVSKLDTIIERYPDLSNNNQIVSCSSYEALHEQDLFIDASLVPLGATLLWKLLSTFNIVVAGCYINLSNLTVIPIQINQNEN